MFYLAAYQKEEEHFSSGQEVPLYSFSCSLPENLYSQYCCCCCCCCRFSRVQLFVTLWAVTHQAPLHGILQAKILERVAMPSFRGSFGPGIKPISLMSPALEGRFFTISATSEAPIHVYSHPNLIVNFLISI